MNPNETDNPCWSPAVFLMLRAKQGERESFDQLVTMHRTGLIQYLMRLLRSREAAEDMAQETFLRAYRARAHYEPTAKFETWLYRIATNTALNYIRDERYHLACLKDSLVSADRCLSYADRRPNIHSSLIREEAATKIRGAVGALPEKQRAAVLLHKYEELDYQQISIVLGCSMQAVKSLLWRAYERLRADLAQFDQESTLHQRREHSDGARAERK